MSYLLLLIIPLLVVIYQQHIEKNIYCSDPDYAYILNGLNINMHKLPLYCDHPGVPLTIFSAAGIRLTYWLHEKSADIQTDVLLHPAYYEIRLQLMLFFLIVAVTLFSGYGIYKKSKNLNLAIASQSAPFLFSTSLTISSVSFMPDAMLIIILQLFILLIIQYGVKKINNEDTTKELWLFPILSGLALSVKLIVLPILLLPILFIGFNIKELVKFFSITALSFIIFTLPVIKQYPYMFNWFLSLFTHSGIYGGGSTTIINLDTYYKNIIFIISNNNLMTVFMILSLVWLIYFYYLKRTGRNHYNTFVFKLFFYSIITQIVSILIVSKSFDGKSYYLIVTYALTALSFIIACVLISMQFRFRNHLIQLIFLSSLMVFCILVNLKNYKVDFLGQSMTKIECDELQKFLENNSEYNIVTNASYSLNKNYALLFGLAFSRVHENRLMQLYPKAYFYNVIPEKFTNWYKEVPINSVFKNNKTLLVDRYLSDQEEANFIKNGYAVKLLFSNRIKAVYELANYQFETGNYEVLIKDKIKKIYSDKKWLNAIREKSLQKGISLDSMVYLDAKWMIDTYGK
jgi:hypothetical protein